MMSIDKNKVLSNDNLLGLRGGVQEYIYCCIFFEDGSPYGPPGLSGTGECVVNYELPEGCYIEECDPVQ